MLPVLGVVAFAGVIILLIRSTSQRSRTKRDFDADNHLDGDEFEGYSFNSSREKMTTQVAATELLSSNDSTSRTEEISAPVEAVNSDGFGAGELSDTVGHDVGGGSDASSSSDGGSDFGSSSSDFGDDSDFGSSGSH